MPGYVLGNFFIYSVINAFTPGPGNILALNTVTNYGYKKGRPLYWGIFAGYYVVQVICAVFVFGVSTFLPDLLGIMKYIGAAYILWLAIHIALSKPTTSTVEKSARDLPAYRCSDTLRTAHILLVPLRSRLAASRSVNPVTLSVLKIAESVSTVR